MKTVLNSEQNQKSPLPLNFDAKIVVYTVPSAFAAPPISPVNTQNNQIPGNFLQPQGSEDAQEYQVVTTLSISTAPHKWGAKWRTNGMEYSL